MKVIFTRKIQTQNFENGVRVGGKNESTIPTYIDVIRYDNAISVTETTAGGIDAYEVVISNTENPLRYAVNKYNMMCIGG